MPIDILAELRKGNKIRRESWSDPNHYYKQSLFGLMDRKGHSVNAAILIHTYDWELYISPIQVGYHIVSGKGINRQAPHVKYWSGACWQSTAYSETKFLDESLYQSIEFIYP